MSSSTTRTTSEGYHFDEQNGVTTGLPCRGVIVPSTLEAKSGAHLDVIVIGAGYAGLVAARELAWKGYNVHLLEARDRIGGRTWTSEIDGYPYEMGGTWINWAQPHVWTELSKYRLVDQLEDSRERKVGIQKHTYRSNNENKDVSLEEEARIRESAFSTYCDVDGERGSSVMPNPHSPFYNSEAYSKWDKISAAARYEQVAHKLTPDEKTAVLSTIVSFSGTSPEKVSFGDCFRWWMLVGQTGDFLMDNTQRWKLKSGQTDFALKIFEDAQSSRKLSYSFSTPVEKVEQSSQGVKVTVKGGQTFAARFMVATVPLNTLNDIVFDPPLAKSKQLAASEGQVNYCVKTHVEVEGTDYRTWSAATFPGPLTGVFGDGITPSGNTHLVSFAANDSFTGSDKGFPEIKAAYQTLKPFNIKRMLYHPWATDKYAKGTWCMFSPGFATRFLHDLQAPQGRIYFANSDWADGWRGYIDGAIEQALRASQSITTEMLKVVTAKL